MKRFLLPLGVLFAITLIFFLAFGWLERDAVGLLESLKNRPGQFACLSASFLVLDIALPIPSSVVLYLNGFVLGLGPGFLLSFISLLLSSVVGYYFGQFATLGKGQLADPRADALLERFGPYAILVSRGVPVLAESICFLSGYNRYPLRQYLWLNALGYLPIAALYAMLGQWGSQENAFWMALGVSVLVAILFWGLGRSGWLGNKGE